MKIELEQIGYFLYMEEQEKRQQEQLKVNADLESDLVGVEATTKEDDD